MVSNDRNAEQFEGAFPLHEQAASPQQFASKAFQVAEELDDALADVHVQSPQLRESISIGEQRDDVVRLRCTNRGVQMHSIQRLDLVQNLVVHRVSEEFLVQRVVAGERCDLALRKQRERLRVALELIGKRFVRFEFAEVNRVQEDSVDVR